MFKIGEFSRLTQVSIRMLRYYDEVGLLKPANVDAFTGFRQYEAAQIADLNQIVYLRDSGMNVAQIKQALQEKERLGEYLEQKRIEIEAEIEAEKEKLRKLELAQKEWRKGDSQMHYQVILRKIPSYQVLSLRRRVSDYYAEGELWREMAAFAQEKRLCLSQDTFAIYHDPDYRESDVDIEICACVKKKGRNAGSFVFRDTEPVAAMACTMVYGDFSNIAGAYSAFAYWLQNEGAYHMAGPTRQIVHRGPWNETKPEKYLIELQIPLARMQPD